jgi:uncharacterized protein (TIGR00251 family)
MAGAAPGAVRLSVRVSPGASASAIVGRMADGRLKVRVAAPAEGGRANAALVALLAERLGVARRAVVLVAGRGARDKIVEVTAPAERVRRLGAEERDQA